MGNISMVSEIMIRLTNRCNVCNEVRLIEYTVLFESGSMSGVCSDCRDKLLAKEGIVSEEKTVSISFA